jgi:putative membrane protein
MKKTLLCSAALVFTSCATLAFAQSAGMQSSGNTPLTGTPSAAQPGTAQPGSAQLSETDRNFVMKAAESGLAEVQAGQLAEQKGNSSVRMIGQRMVTDHSKTNDEMKAKAQMLGLSLPTAPSTAEQAQYTALQNATGTAAFDRKYLADQRKAHLRAIALFENEAKNGQNPDLKSLAQQTLPALREHLKMIEAAQR